MHVSGLLFECMMLVINVMYTLNLRKARMIEHRSGRFSDDVLFLACSFFLTILSFAANLVGVFLERN